MTMARTSMTLFVAAALFVAGASAASHGGDYSFTVSVSNQKIVQKTSGMDLPGDNMTMTGTFNLKVNGEEADVVVDMMVDAHCKGFDMYGMPSGKSTPVWDLGKGWGYTKESADTKTADCKTLSPDPVTFNGTTYTVQSCASLENFKYVYGGEIGSKVGGDLMLEVNLVSGSKTQKLGKQKATTFTMPTNCKSSAAGISALTSLVFAMMVYFSS